MPIISGGSSGGTVISVQTATVLTSESTSSNSYTDLTTPGPSVTVTVGATGVVVVGYSVQCTGNGANFAAISLVLSGANTVAASDDISITFAGNLIVGRTHAFSGLTAGATTIKMQYKSIGGVALTFQRRDLWAFAA